MKPQIPAQTARRAALAVIALVALVSGGCSKKLRTQLIPNQAPEVRLTAAPVQPDSARPDFYAYTMQWVGYDPDGRVDHFLYAVDAVRPDSLDTRDTTWHSTVKNEQTFFFSAGVPITPINPNDPRAERSHTFSIYAVDNDGQPSKRPAVRAFFSFTQCPEVHVTDPVPNRAFTLNLTPTVIIQWGGKDPDGVFNTKPVRWVYRLFGESNPDSGFRGINFINYALTHANWWTSYAPDFKGWDSVSGDTTRFQYHNLNTTNYMFVVTGFDEAGAYDPVFLNGKNMLQFSVTYAGTSGPVIRMFNQFFDYTYPGGGWDPSESKWFHLEVPASTPTKLIPLTFNWGASPPKGADIQRYRWVMDMVDLTDETPRRNESDWSERHWSAWSRLITSATIGVPVPGTSAQPFYTNDETHLFFIEAEDNNGLQSLGIIFFRVVLSTFDKSLLIVDDTRMIPDFRSTPGGDMNPPVGPWPTAAELDTFLYAKGGFPWNSYPGWGTATPTLSTPGIFNGYDYDTTGTRGVSLDGTVPLSLLGHYRHVIWYTDPNGANYAGSPSDVNTPITALRLVNSPGRPVILSTFISQGGIVWLSGGGAAYASLITWNKLGTQPNVYTARDGELVPGRMMYDIAHWQTTIAMLPEIQVRKFGTTSYGVGTNRPGRGWPATPIPPTPLTPPDYTLLPAVLNPKNPATDPVPPLRTAPNFYQGNFLAEYINEATFIREDYDDDPDRLAEYSTLDTLYLTVGGGAAPPNAACMTYYHGRENSPFVFSGFNFWYWRRQQCISLVDWVLQSVWGLTRDSGAPRQPTAPMAARRAAR
jgi:hypothetical protein